MKKGCLGSHELQEGNEKADDVTVSVQIGNIELKVDFIIYETQRLFGNI